MPSQWWSEDDRLLGMLGEALRVGDAPPELIDAGKLAYTTHDIDAQLAALTYDSLVDGELSLAATRADPIPLRTLTFVSDTRDDDTIELYVEILDDAIKGQLAPPRPGTIDALLANGDRVTSTVDETGYFTFRPIPSGQLRLQCRLAGHSFVTGWIEP